MQAHVWKLGVGLGVVAGVAFLLSETELVRETVWLVTLLGACAGVAVGIRAHRPTRQHPWWLLFTALAILAVANLLDYPLWATPASTAWSDPLAILAFPLIGVGALALSRAQAPGGDRESAIDGAIVMVAMAAVLSGTAYHPQHLGGEVDLAARVLHTVVAPLMMAAVAAATFRLLFVGSLRIASAWLVVAAAVMALVGNAVRAVLVSAGLYERGVWTDLFILLAYVSIALASLHPSAPSLTAPADRRYRRFTYPRLIVLGLALLAAPATILARGTGGDQFVTVLATAVVSLLVLWRLSRMAVERERSRRELHNRADRQAALAALGRHALDATSVDDLVAETLRACRDHVEVDRCELAGAVATPSDLTGGDTVVLPVAEDGRALVVQRRARFSAEERAFLASAAHLVTLAIERHAAQQAMEQAAIHDALTGLPNRRRILERLAEILRRTQREGRSVCVMFIDLDGFKRVNDDHGHQVGDAVLVAAARRLQDVFRGEDTVGRLAGDEFVVIAEHVSDQAARSSAHRVLTSLSHPFQVQGCSVRVGVSLGLTIPLADVGDPERVLAQADAAMYVAKAQLGPSMAVYDGVLGATREQQRELERELERALADGEFALVYQPLWRLDDHSPIGAEALLRWDHPERGRLDPGAFLAVAEQSDLILAIGEWVLERATEQLARWQVELPASHPWALYVNLAGRQLLVPGLVEQVRTLLARHDVRPDRLGFEVSERAVVDDRVVATATTLASLGVRLAWDDFGTGFSSISHLRGWPLDIIKLDGSLVQSAVSSPEDAGIVRAMCSVAHELGMEVLAEHVDSAEQLATVEHLGCDLAQGYHLGRPVEAGELRLPRRPEDAPVRPVGSDADRWGQGPEALVPARRPGPDPGVTTLLGAS
ncbi:MAG: bifunctional diguanylate cyclase/phosphodiesterase [Nitriliruptor sp.]|nr:MAG: bifunctional diguanylate cyclase/phosphodiesterase [Nitriliruptor sp.]